MEINSKLKNELNRIIELTEIYDQYGIEPSEIELKQFSDNSTIIYLGETTYIKPTKEYKPIINNIHTHPPIIQKDDKNDNEFTEYFSPNDLNNSRFFPKSNMCILFRKDENEQLNYYLKCVNTNNINSNNLVQYNDIYNQIFDKGFISEDIWRKSIENAKTKDEINELMNYGKIEQKNNKILKEELSNFKEQMKQIENQMQISTEKFISTKKKERITIEPSIIIYYTDKDANSKWYTLFETDISKRDYANFKFYQTFDNIVGFASLRDTAKNKSILNTNLIENKSGLLKTKKEIIENLSFNNLAICVKTNPNAHKKCYTKSDKPLQQISSKKLTKINLI